MDKIGANFAFAVGTIKDRLGANPVPIQLPIGAEKDFVGFVDLVRMVYIEFVEDSNGREYLEGPIPEEHADAAAIARAEMLEAVADSDDELMELLLEDKEVSEEIAMRAIRAATLSMVATPVLAGSALKHKGVRFVLDAVIDFLPAQPEIPDVEGTLPFSTEKITRKSDPSDPVSLMAFKTIAQPTGDLTFVRVYSGVLEKGTRLLNPRTGKNERIGRIVRMHADKQEAVDAVPAGDIAAIIGLKNTITGDTLCDEDKPIALAKMTFPDPVISMSLEPESSQDRDKLSEIIGRMMREDPSFRAQTIEETGELVISGMGELHLEVVVNRIKNDHKCGVRTGAPKVAFK
jgi:elongation factor G